MYIFDSYRPINHNNIHTKKGVYVVDDGMFGPVSLIPDDEDFALLEAQSEAEEENDDPNQEETSELRKKR